MLLYISYVENPCEKTGLREICGWKDSGGEIAMNNYSPISLKLEKDQRKNQSRKKIVWIVEHYFIII